MPKMSKEPEPVYSEKDAKAFVNLIKVEATRLIGKRWHTVFKQRDCIVLRGYPEDIFIWCDFNEGWYIYATFDKTGGKRIDAKSTSQVNIVQFLMLLRNS